MRLRRLALILAEVGAGGVVEKKQINEEILSTFGTDYSKRMNLDVTGARSSIFPTPGLLDILYPLDLSCCLTSQQSQWWFTPFPQLKVPAATTTTSFDVSSSTDCSATSRV